MLRFMLYIICVAASMAFPLMSKTQPSTARLLMTTSSSSARPVAVTVPAGISGVESLMCASLLEGLAPARRGNNRRFFVEVRTPGLNDRIEQAAIVSKELLFELVGRSAAPTLLRIFATVKLMFPSSGDAAGFQSYCMRRGIVLPAGLVLTDLAPDRLEPEDQCLVVLSARNNVGDPVVRTVQAVAEQCTSSAVLVLLNCDLADRVASGMTARTQRDAFRASFQPLFYFRNVVSIQRPSQVPLERGALVYTAGGGWRLFAADQARITGPGSLNRFMRTPCFRRAADDPSERDPPAMVLARTFDSAPRRDDIEEALSVAEFSWERLLARQAAAPGNYTAAVDILRTFVSKDSESSELALDALVFVTTHTPPALTTTAPAANSDASGATESASRSLLGSGERMGAVDLRLMSEDVVSEEAAAPAATPAETGRTDFAWSSSTLELLAGSWRRRLLSGEESQLDDTLVVTAPAKGAAGPLTVETRRLAASRTGSLTLLPSSLLRCVFTSQSLFGLRSRLDPESSPAVEIALIHIDAQLAVLREQPSGTLSFWRRS